MPLLWLFIGIGSSLLAKDPTLHFKHLSLDEGLSQNSVFCILQDQKGFLWFATQDGINKYDGYDFTIYKPDAENPNSLSFNWINTLYEDSSGIIWIGTDAQGVNTFNPRTETFFRYPVTPNTDSPMALNNGSIIAILQDTQGDIWFATRFSGLTRITRQWDPISKKRIEKFRHYHHSPGKPGSLASNITHALYLDRMGTLWVGTHNQGLSKWNPKTETFTHYSHSPKNPNSLNNNEVSSIFEDRTGQFWVGTYGGGLNLMDRESGTFLCYPHDPGNPNSLGSNFINTIYEDRSGILWIGTADSGLCRFDKRSESFSNYRKIPQDPTSLNNDNITVIFEDQSRVLWVGTNGGGLNRFDRENKFQLLRSDPINKNSLSDSFIYAIYEDQQGILWIGTNSGGLNEYHRDSHTFIQHRHDPNNPQSINDNLVRAIIEDRYGDLWVGTTNGGLNRFDRKTRTFRHYQNNPGDPTSLSSNGIRVLLEDSTGVLWIGTTIGGLEKFNRETQTFTHHRANRANPDSYGDNQIYALYEAPSEPGIIWVGSASSGLNRYDPRTGITDRFPPDPANPDSLSHNTVLTIHEDQTGTLWIGTYGGGLNKMVRQPDGKHRFIHYSEKNGLANNSIYGILEDPEGRLWISTNKGLSCLDPKSDTFKNYNARDGLQGNEFNAGAYYKNKNGEMFFGGINGLNTFFPFHIKNNLHIPAIVFTDFKLFNKPVPIGASSPLKQSISWTREIYLTYKQNTFSFQFSALDFTVPENNIYAYKMENLEEDWNHTDATRRFATYTNMPPGKYTFRVKGSNNDGVLNEEGAAIKIFISPPFWQTWWFRLLLLFSTITLFVYGYKKRLRNDRLKFELRTAHDAQMSIMPQSDPTVKGYDISGICVPASEVGGDFFDYIWMDDEKTKLCIVIGDVSGKAMKSAMTAVLTSGMIYSQVGQFQSVKEIMQQVNRPLYYKTDKNVFTAICLAALELSTRGLTFCNAGLHSPLLILPNTPNHTIFPLIGEGKKLPLGIKIDTPYQEKKQLLNPGDTLIFFTDGITDAKNLEDTFYGYNRLIQLLEKIDITTLTAREIKDTIIADVNRFSKNAAQHDDITLVVLKVLQ